MTDKVNVLLVDDQPDKLLAYEVILDELDENLVKTSSAREALQFLLKNDVAVILIDVCMPELDGFELAAMIREHPRFSETAIIFISAIHLTDVDRLRGYAMGAVDYVPVPVIPEVLRAKVKVFVELYRKTRELEQLNLKLERHVAERTAELEASNARLVQSEQGRSLALAAGQMGSWEWDIAANRGSWDEGQYRIFGVEPEKLSDLDGQHPPALASRRLGAAAPGGAAHGQGRTHPAGRIPRAPSQWRIALVHRHGCGECRCGRQRGADQRRHHRRHRAQGGRGAAGAAGARGRSSRPQCARHHPVDHQLTRAKSVDDYVATVEGRIKALARAHTLLSDSRWHGADLGTLVAEELAPYRSGNKVELKGPNVSLSPATAQGIALALHELATNAAKHGALSSLKGRVSLTWQLQSDMLTLHWAESGGPPIKTPSARSFGLKVIKASIEQQLGGKATFDWNPQGLRCDLAIALREARRSPRAGWCPSGQWRRQRRRYRR